MFEVPVTLKVSTGTINIEVLVYYCETEKEGVCKYKDIYFEVPVNVTNPGENEIKIEHELK
jgi:hypothetical protein